MTTDERIAELEAENARLAAGRESATRPVRRSERSNSRSSSLSLICACPLLVTCAYLFTALLPSNIAGRATTVNATPSTGRPRRLEGAQDGPSRPRRAMIE